MRRKTSQPSQQDRPLFARQSYARLCGKSKDCFLKNTSECCNHLFYMLLQISHSTFSTIRPDNDLQRSLGNVQLFRGQRSEIFFNQARKGRVILTCLFAPAESSDPWQSTTFPRPNIRSPKLESDFYFRLRPLLARCAGL